MCSQGQFSPTASSLLPRSPLERALLVALAVALSALITAAIGWRAALVPLLVFGWVGVLLGSIDARTRLLPNRILHPALLTAVVLLTAAAVLENPSPATAAAQLLGSATGILLGWGLMHVVWWFARGGIGYGDVRLAGYIGLHLGYLTPTLVLTALTLGFAAAAGAGIIIAIKRRSLRAKFALGPYLIAAAVLVLTTAGRMPVAT